MPLLAASGAKIEHLCLACEAEREMPPSEARAHEDDPGFSIDCPTCGATESFAWHNWIYQRPRRPHERKGRPDPERPGGLIIDRDPIPDPDAFGAKQMVLIEKVARRLGQAKPTQVPGRRGEYERPPKAPSRGEVRAYVQQLLHGNRPSAGLD